MKTVSAQAISDVCCHIAPLSPERLKTARAHLDRLTKPVGSLGRVEDIAARMIAIREDAMGEPLSKAIYVFAADHGIADEGVSAYPREVTQQMVLNFLSNGAAINVLAKVQHADLLVVDVGVDAEFPGAPGLVHRKVRRGTRNMLREPAMIQEELSAALQAGMDLADDAKRDRRDLVAIGEMGIANTSAASAMAAALTGHPVSLVTGKGTGLDKAGHRHKVSVLESVMRRHFADSEEPNSPLEILRGVGGLEIAAMTGFMLGAARNRIAIVVDGFISTAAAAIAWALEPQVKDYMFAGHLSEEPGHKLLLAHIGIEPILQLKMRLGEASGAAMALSVIESAVCLYREMATFQSAGVSEARG